MQWFWAWNLQIRITERKKKIDRNWTWDFLSVVDKWSRDLNTGLWLVSAGHVTWMLVSDWSRVWPSQHRSQLWAEKRAPAERITVSIWAERGDHRVSSECQLEKWRLSSTEEQAELSIISSRGLKIIWRTVRASCQHQPRVRSVKILWSCLVFLR